MTDEEKKAIEQLKHNADSITSDILGIQRKNLKKLLNLIEKQQKEIEQLKFENHMVKKWNEQLDKNCISKDKIRDILNYLNDTELNNYEIVIAFKKMMKELLEEDGDHIPRID